MLLKDLLNEEMTINKWSVYNHKDEQIAMTSRSILINLCMEKKEFQKSVDKVVEKVEKSSFIKVKLKSNRK